MTRRSISPALRARVFASAGGVCHLCGEKIHGGEAWEVEHVRALALLGEDAEENMRPAHRACHRAKTKGDVARIAKAKRQCGEKGQQARRKSGKTKRITSRGFEGWRTFAGDIVRKNHDLHSHP